MEFAALKKTGEAEFAASCIMSDNRRQGAGSLSNGDIAVIVFCAVMASGLGIACVGILLKYDTLYYTGLIIASPMFIVVLPVLILLLIATFLVILISPVVWILRRTLPGRRKQADTQGQ